jgi:hypothetical protein
MSVSNDIVGQLLGHKQNKTVTDRYGKINYYSTGKYIDQMLDKMFSEVKNNSENLDEKIEIIKSLFPNKDENIILKIIELLK